jgi:hypothetical protein
LEINVNILRILIYLLVLFINMDIQNNISLKNKQNKKYL